MLYINLHFAYCLTYQCCQWTNQMLPTLSCVLKLPCKHAINRTNTIILLITRPETTENLVLVTILFCLHAVDYVRVTTSQSSWHCVELQLLGWLINTQQGIERRIHTVWSVLDDKLAGRVWRSIGRWLPRYHDKVLSVFNVVYVRFVNVWPQHTGHS